MRRDLIWCLNYRNNGVWSLLSDYRTRSEALALAVSAYINWGGRIRTAECTPNQLVIECPPVLGAKDVLYLISDNTSALLLLRDAIEKVQRDGWRGYYKAMAHQDPPKGMRPYQAMWAMWDHMECPDIPLEECVRMCWGETCHNPNSVRIPGPYSEYQPPPCYGGRLPINSGQSERARMSA